MKDHSAWMTFDQRYRSILLAFFSRRGIQSVEAADLTQETLVDFLELWQRGDYKRERGQVRSLILKIASAREADFLRKQRAEQASDTVLERQPAPDELEAAWETAWRQNAIFQALERLRTHTDLSASTIQAFESTFIDHLRPTEVAASLGLSVTNVYVARHRCLNHLERILKELAEEMEDSQLGALLRP
jgi:RNA polymerase sigma factor (sigma-70 family)